MPAIVSSLLPLQEMRKNWSFRGMRISIDGMLLVTYPETGWLIEEFQGVLPVTYHRPPIDSVYTSETPGFPHLPGVCGKMEGKR